MEDVTTTGSITSVRAVVVPPEYDPDSSPTPGGVSFPTCELNGSPSGRYQAVCSGFTTPGQYLVTIFAEDTEGNASGPKVITVTRK